MNEAKVILDDRLIFYHENFSTFADFIKSLFKREQLSYPKFYKMDALSKLGFLTAELLLKDRDLKRYPAENVGIVLCNAAASLDTDMAHQETIRDRSAYFPSPSVFVYTLPNIVTGEICIRHGIKGENLFLISGNFDPMLLHRHAEEMFRMERCQAVITGWTDLLVNRYRSIMFLVEEAEGNTGYGFSAAAMQQIFDRT